MKTEQHLIRAIPMALAGLLLPLTAAQGYGGPGSIVTGVGAFLAAVVAVGAALVGFVWYPVKRLIRAFQSAPDEVRDDVMSDSS